MRPARKILLFLVLPIASLLLGVRLLIGTETGTRWLVRQAEPMTDGALAIGELQGHLLDRLVVRDLRWRDPGIEVQLAELDLHWNPMALWQAKLEILSLHASDIRVRSFPTATPAEPSATAPTWPPVLPDPRLPFAVKIADLQLDRIEIQGPDAEPRLVDRLQLVARLEQEARLQIEKLEILAPQGRISLLGQADLQAPYPIRLSGDWRLQLQDGPQAAGRLSLQGDGRELRLDHDGEGELPLNLHGRLEDVFGDPLWSLRLDWPEFRLPGEPEQRFPAGTLTSQGRLDAYDFRLNLQPIPGRLAAALRLEAVGDRQGVTLRTLELDSPQGRAGVQGRIDWSEAIAFDLGLAASSFDPALPPGLGLRGHLLGRAQGQQLILSGLELELEGTPTRLKLQGEVDWGAIPEPLVQARLQWSGLDWPPGRRSEAEIRTQGTATLNGSAQDYALETAFELAGRSLPSGHWQLKAKGGRQELALVELNAEVLQGWLRGSGALQWRPGLAGQLDLRLCNLQPHELLPDWPVGTPLAASLWLGLDGDWLEIQPLELSLPGTQGRLTLSARGRLDPKIEESEFEAELNWDDLAWPLAGPAAQVASAKGHLGLSGHPRDYRLDGQAQLAGARIPAGDWRLQGQGDTRGFSLTGLDGRLLEGSVRLAGRLGWQPRPSWELTLSGRELNPAGLAPQWPGRLRLEARSRGTLDPKRGAEIELGGVRLEGQVRERPLELGLEGRWQDQALQLDTLSLKAGPNKLNARGRLGQEKIAFDWSLDAPDLAALIPGAGGRLSGGGKIAGQAATPTLEAKINGEGLVWQEHRLKRLDGRLLLGRAEDAPLELQLSLSELRRGQELVLQSAKVQGKGRLSAQQLNLELLAPSAALEWHAEGGLDSKGSAWQGRLGQLSLRTPDLGSWHLQQPVDLRLAANGARLGEGCLVQQGSEARLCTALRWDQPGSTELSARLQGLSLAMLRRDVSGTLSGELQAGLDPQGHIKGAGNLKLTPGQLQIPTADGGRQLSHGGGRLEFGLDPRGLQASLSLQPLEQGRVEANLALPDLTRLPLSPQQPLNGRLTAVLPNLDLLPGFLPQLRNTSGRLNLGLDLSGALPNPQLGLSLQLLQGGAELPQAGVTLRDIQLALVDRRDQPGRYDLKGQLSSGLGVLQLRGELDQSTQSASLSLQGRNIQVFDTPDARVRIAPDLQLAWSEGGLKVRGRIEIPEAEITPQIPLNPAMLLLAPKEKVVPGRRVATSADVVVRRRQGEPQGPLTKPPARPVDADMELLLGEGVRVDAVGFKAGVRGRLRLAMKPGQADLIPTAEGSLHIRDGVFRGYGQDLDIEWGRILFNRVPLTEPELDIRAVRQIKGSDEVSAVGVHLSGTPAAPELNLFSRPQLDDAAIQSYLLTGSGPNSQERLLGVGSYLRPDVYVGYGFNLLDRTHEFNARYDINRYLGVETNIGEADKSMTLSTTWER